MQFVVIKNGIAVYFANTQEECAQYVRSIKGQLTESDIIYLYSYVASAQVGVTVTYSTSPL